MAEGWKTGGLFSGIEIPAPTGVHSVGCVDVMLELEGDSHGGLLVRLFYPTSISSGSNEVGGYSYASWLPYKEYIKGYLTFNKNKFSGILSSIFSWLINPKMPALMKAPLLTQQNEESTATPTSPPTFPVIVFSHGLGAMRLTYSAILCDLASHGYVVASVEHRDQSACVSHRKVPGPDGQWQDQWLPCRFLEPGEDEFPLRNKQVKQRADEVGKTLDILTLLNDGAQVKDIFGSGYDFGQFKGRLDLSKVGVVGHSFGGATSIQTVQQDSRFKCGIALDCWMLPLYRDAKDSVGSSLSQPFYFINSYTFQWKDNVLKEMSLCQPPDSLGKTPQRVLTLDETDHMHQTDLWFVIPKSLGFLTVSKSGQDAVKAHHVNMDICHAFLKRHLLKDPAYEGPIPNLDGCEGHSPVIIFGSNLDLSCQEVNEQSSKGAGTHEEEDVQTGGNNEGDTGANKL